MQDIGLIGVGWGGKMFVDDLHDQGYSITCYERGNQIEYAKRQGAAMVDTHAGVAEQSDIIILAVPGTPEVETVMEGKDGLLTTLEDGQLVIDTTTTKAETAIEYRSKCADQGVHWVNAPWTTAAPAEGLIMMVGGDTESYNAARSVIETISSDHIRFSDVKRAMVFKYLLQIRYAARTAVDAEIIEIAKTVGLDPSPLNSVMGMDISEKLFDEDYVPTQEGMGSLEMWDKDLGYALEFGHSKVPEHHGIAMPLTSAVHEAYKHGNRVAEPDETHATAVAQYWRTLNNR
jgi:3-hydroxyisobutyrate dehydrogenase-like beta-hydroxyacid dehydrogenase